MIRTQPIILPLLAFAITFTGCSRNDAADSTTNLGRVNAASASEPACLADESSMVTIPGTTFAMGSAAFYREEAPVRSASVETFQMDVHEVTNRQFAEFVTATGHVTLAEKNPDPALHPSIPAEKLVPGSAVFQQSDDTGGGAWAFVPGADWRHPEGPNSSLDGRMDHPVVHIAYGDARAYADWAGGELPTEAQWELAARGGLDGATYEWGETPPDGLKTPRANTWQGLFPLANKARDGFTGLAPVGCFEPNGFGLHDMTGNVWEWVRDADPERNIGTIKGGSYLCADNYCRRYRPAARHPQELDFSTNHIGFRIIKQP